MVRHDDKRRNAPDAPRPIVFIGGFVTRQKVLLMTEKSSYYARRQAKALARSQEPAQPRSSSWRLPLTGVLGVLLLVISWYWGRSTQWSWLFPLGIVCAVGGLLTRIWATGWLVKNETLTTNGPYQLTRNPLYLGTLLIVLGQALMSGVPWTVVLFPPLCLALYWPTLLEEEKFLSQRYGEEYGAYAKQVPLLFPLWRAPGAARKTDPTQEFSWRRVQRCYKGFLGNALLISIYLLLHQAR